MGSSKSRSQKGILIIKTNERRQYQKVYIRYGTYQNWLSIDLETVYQSFFIGTEMYTFLNLYQKGESFMKRYGYHRTSTREQHLDRGIAEITAYCDQNQLELEKIFTDQQTGKNFNRPRYQILKEDVLRPGDELIITEVDRLGRNKLETLKELHYFKDNGIIVRVLEIPTTLIDYSNLDNAMASMLMETVNSMLIELYAALAQAEIEKKEKRQREGIQAKKDRGEWSDYGRPSFMSDEDFTKEYQKVLSGEIKPFDLMRQLNMKKSTFYRYIKRINHTH